MNLEILDSSIKNTNDRKVCFVGKLIGYCSHQSSDIKDKNSLLRIQVIKIAFFKY